MCGKGGGSPPVPGQTSTGFQGTTSPSPVAAPLYSAFLNNANALQAGTGFNPATLGTAVPMNPYETGAGTDLYNIGTGMANYANQVSNLGTGMAAQMAPIAASAQQAGTWDPTQVQAIESPYTSDVVNATQNWFNQQNAIQGQDLMSQAIRSGNAFGGDRPGIAEAQLAGQQQLAQAPVIAGLRQAGYQQALQQYNQLKQLGLAGGQEAMAADQQALAGAQAGLGAQGAALQGAQIAGTYGQQVQAQAQREADVAQQNALMQQAFPFQLQNWYGSVLGGVGPLTGTFAQSYTTPPSPTGLQTAAGIASGIAGIGAQLFGKRGGPVERAHGGLVRRWRNGGWVSAPASGGLTRFRGGYVPVLARARGGLVPIMLQMGGSIGSTDDQDQNQRRNVGVGGSAPGLGGTSDDQPVNVTDPDSGVNIQVGQGARQISIPNAFGALTLPPQLPPAAPKPQQQQQQQTTTQPAQDTTGMTSLLKSVGTLAPLALMLQRGGPVRYFQDGGTDGDQDDDGDQTTGQGGGPSTASPSQTQWPPSPLAPLPPAPSATGPTTPGAGGEPLGGPSDLGAQPSAQPPAGFTPGALTGGGGPRVAGLGRAAAPPQTIAGLGPPQRSFLSRIGPALTAFGAGLLSSPYQGQALSRAFAGAGSALEQSRREGMLDQRPQMLDTGNSIKYRVGNKIIDTGLPRRKRRTRGAPFGRVTASSPFPTATFAEGGGVDDDKDQDTTTQTPPTPPAAAAPTPPAEPAAPVPTVTRQTQFNPATGLWEPTPPAGPALPLPPLAGAPAAVPPIGTTKFEPRKPGERELTPEEKKQEGFEPDETKDHEAKAAQVWDPDTVTSYFKQPADVDLAFLEKMHTTPEAFDFNAARLAQGDVSILRIGGYGKDAAAYKMALQTRAAQYWEDRGLGPEDANAAVVELGARKKGAASLSTMEGRLTTAIQEASATAPMVLDVSARIPRTQYPSINNLIIAAKKQTGDEDVIRLGTTVETLINNYAAALGRGSGVLTDHARQRASEMLERGYTHGQMGAAVDQMMMELDREKRSLQRGLSAYLGQTREEPYEPGSVLKPRPPGGTPAVPTPPAAKPPVATPPAGAGETKTFQGHRWQLKPGADRSKKESWTDLGPA